MATIKIKRMIKPIEIEHSRGVSIKNMWLGINGQRKRDDDEILDLGDIFSGSYKQIEWINTTQEYQKNETRHSSNQESKDFEERFLKPYLNDRGYLLLEREFDFLADKGCLMVTKIKPEGQCFTASHFRIAIVGRMIDQYENYSKLIDDWKEYKSRIAFAKNMDLKSLDTSFVAEKMKKNFTQEGLDNYQKLTGQEFKEKSE